MDIGFNFKKLSVENREFLTEFLEYFDNGSPKPVKYNYFEPINKEFKKENIPNIVEETLKENIGLLLRFESKFGMWLDINLNSRNLISFFGCFRYKQHDEEKINYMIDSFLKLYIHFSIEYGRMMTDEEEDLRNKYEEIKTYPTGQTSSVVGWGGAYLDEGYPGLYWLNFFGKKSIAYFGRDRLLNCPAYKIYEPGPDSIVIQLYEFPEDFDKTDIHKRALEHLGEESFFDVTNPDRELASKHVICKFTPPKKT